MPKRRTPKHRAGKITRAMHREWKNYGGDTNRIQFLDNWRSLANKRNRVYDDARLLWAFHNSVNYYIHGVQPPFTIEDF